MEWAPWWWHPRTGCLLLHPAQDVVRGHPNQTLFVRGAALKRLQAHHDNLGLSDNVRNSPAHRVPLHALPPPMITQIARAATSKSALDELVARSGLLAPHRPPGTLEDVLIAGRLRCSAQPSDGYCRSQGLDAEAIRAALLLQEQGWIGRTVAEALPKTLALVPVNVRVHLVARDALCLPSLAPLVMACLPLSNWSHDHSTSTLRRKGLGPAVPVPLIPTTAHFTSRVTVPVSSLAHRVCPSPIT
jgi:hypothetical protein